MHTTSISIFSAFKDRAVLSPASRCRLARVALCVILVCLLALTRPAGAAPHPQAYTCPPYDPAVPGSMRQSDCQALVDFYYQTGGPNWKNNTGWLADNSPCNWYGVGCTTWDEHGYIWSIGLPDNNLSGPFTAVEDMPMLHYFAVASNKLTGSLNSLCAHNYYYVSLNNNLLSGEIPECIGNQAEMWAFQVGYNQLSGSIPPQMGNLGSLRELWLQGNQLSGSIPAEMGNLASLRWMRMESNRLEGKIPASLGNLTILEQFDLSSNRLRGSVPAELSGLVNVGNISLWNNPNLSGPLPDSFRALAPSKLGLAGTKICVPVNADFDAWLAGDPNADPNIGRCAWTYMVYLAGDNNLDTDYARRVFWRLERADRNPNVQVVVLRDSGANPDKAGYYKTLYPFGNELPTYTVNENFWPKTAVNMGSPQTLIDFINWARTNYPAEHYALIMSDHGTGLGGAMVDESSGNDWLTIPELGQALRTATNNGADKIDVLYMNACLMAMIEDAYQMRDTIDYYVASESIQWTTTGQFEYDVLGVGPTATARDVAYNFAGQYASTTNLPYTISVMDMSKISGVITAINPFALALKTTMTQHALEVLEVSVQVQRFDNNNDNLIDTRDVYIDLFDFAMRIKNRIPDDAEIQTTAQGVMDAVAQFVLLNNYTPTAPDLQGSRGVSIFFPGKRSSFYQENNFDFADGTIWNNAVAPRAQSSLDGMEWGPMLVSYFEVTQPGGPDDPNLPVPLPLQIPRVVYLPAIQR